MTFEDVPWTYVLPIMFFCMIPVGLLLKRIQDRTVQYVRKTIKPGDLHIDDIPVYRRKVISKAT